MGFSLGSFLGGAADGASKSMDNAKVDREEERKKVEDMIFRTSARLFENANVVQQSRSAKKKVDDKFMNTLISSAPSMQTDPAKQAFVLGLDETARNDLLTMVIDPSFNPERRPLVDYLEAIDDPIEFKDPVTLNQRVQGKVVDRPLDKSSYYGVSNTEDKEVDKIVSSYTNAFSVAYDMSAAKAQGLLASATNEVKVQSFTIDWIVKRRDRAQVVAQTAAQVATAQLGTEKAKLSVKDSLISGASTQLEATRLNYIRSSGQSEKVFDTLPENQTKFLASAEYKAATKAIISSAVQRMEENPVIKESTERFLADSFPGKWGGRVGDKDIETVDQLKDNVYYEGTFTNGPGIALGSVIKAAKAAQGKQGVSAGDITTAEKDSTYTGGDVIKPKKVVTANIAQQDTNIADMKELGESENTIQREQDYKDKLIKAESVVDFFNNLDEAPSASDASKLVDAVTEIVSEGKAEDIQSAIDKILSMKSGLGQSPIVSAAVSNSLNVLAAAQDNDRPNVTEDSMAKIKVDLASDTEWTELRIKNTIKEVNAYPEWAIKTDKVKDLKAALYAKLEAL